MPVELRKRPAPPPAPPPKAKKAATSKTKAKKEDSAPKETKPPASNPTDDPKGGIPDGAGGVSATAEVTSAEVANDVAAKAEANAVKGKSKGKAAKESGGSAVKEVDSITLEGFGGEVETNDGEKTTLAKLVESSKSGVVLFTYPKASTPGCKLLRQSIVVGRC